jgi:hypothetical protein
MSGGETLHSSYDSLLESDPEFQQRMAEARIEGQQKLVLALVVDRFPALAELAQQKIVRLTKQDMLMQLNKQIAFAPDENTVRWVLNTFAA